MKSRTVMMMIALMSVALMFGCATSGKMDPNMVRTDDLNLWEDAGWVDLTMAEQALWMEMGWNEASWEGEAKKPPSEDLYWNQLSEKERMAATKLGYTKATWDE